MMSRPWTLREEQFIKDNIGRTTTKAMAVELKRSHGATRTHIHEMRKAGRLPWHTKRVVDVPYISDLTECRKCNALRTSVDGDGVCRVCRAQERLEGHRLRMHRAYANLPKELQERTNGSFRIERNPALMTKSKDLTRPKRPDTRGLDEFDAQAVTDDWLAALEAYELAMIQLDADATKQRTSKWNRKAREYRRKKRKRS